MLTAVTKSTALASSGGAFMTTGTTIRRNAMPG
jgi:hypothetical protein